MFEVIVGYSPGDIVGLKSRLSHAVFILVSAIPKILKRKVSSSNRWVWKFSKLRFKLRMLV